MGKFVLYKTWKGIVGSYNELTDAKKAAMEHAVAWGVEKPQKWKYNKSTSVWYNSDYTIRFET